MASIRAGNPNPPTRLWREREHCFSPKGIVARKMARYDMENSKWLYGFVPPSFHLRPDAEEYGRSEF
jgi:hypothetical protein